MNPTRRTALAASFLASGALAAPVEAKPAAPAGKYVVPFSEIVTFKSKINEVAYALYVRTPATYALTPGKLPLIVTLDADYSFALAANHLEHLSGRADQAPDTILVSIAYPGVYPDRKRYEIERTRDYTPVVDKKTEPDKTSGGAPAFLRVIAEEILPLVEKRWRVDPTDRTLVGHSYGGLFGAFTLQTRPDLFNRFLLASPSLWYADSLILKREEGLHAARQSRKTRVWLGVGSHEEEEQPSYAMVTNLKRFAAQLAARGDGDLLVLSRVFEDETHASVFPAAFSTGIRHLFRGM